MEAPIDLLMTTYYRREFTRKVIDHILERTKTPFQFIIVDNGSLDGTQEMLESYKLLHPEKFKKIIYLGKNEGLQASKNIGMEFVESEFFVNTDNDCLCPDLQPDWLAQLQDLIKRHPDYGAIAMRPQVLVGVGPIFQGAGEVVENNVAGGSFRIMNTQAVRDVNLWENLRDSRNEEWHICGKLRDKGLKVGYAKNLFTYHMFSENWGYSMEVEHYHNKEKIIYAKDEAYDPITMVPNIKHNE